MGMLIVVDPHSGVPVYRQLMDQIKFHVNTGLLTAGAELPSTRALSAELGVNPMTISKAYSYLERDQVIERRPGRPLVVKAIEEDQIMENKLTQLRENLLPVITQIKQLGLKRTEVINVFSELLDSPAGTTKSGKEELDR
jgi:GntR family transcriptional regulator